LFGATAGGDEGWVQGQMVGGIRIHALVVCQGQCFSGLFYVVIVFRQYFAVVYCYSLSEIKLEMCVFEGRVEDFAYFVDQDCLFLEGLRGCQIFLRWTEVELERGGQRYTDCVLLCEISGACVDVMFFVLCMC